MTFQKPTVEDLALVGTVLAEVQDVVREGREMLEDGEVSLDEVAALVDELLDLVFVLSSLRVRARIERGAGALAGFSARARAARRTLTSLRKNNGKRPIG